MWCDAQRRVVERCDAPRRAALPTVMSISPTRLIDDPNMVQSRGDFKTALLPWSPSLSIAPKKPRLLDRRTTIAHVLDHYPERGRTALIMVRFAEMSLKGRVTCQTPK